MSKRKADNSRRNFIKNSALALGGFYIVPRHVIGGKGFTAPSDKLQIAGIGAGGKGESDLLEFYRTGKVDVAFLCDVDDRQCAAQCDTGSHRGVQHAGYTALASLPQRPVACLASMEVTAY